MFPFILPLVGAAAGAVINKKNPLSGAAMGALGGAAPGLLGAAAPAAAAGGAAASGAGGLLAATGGAAASGAGGIGSALAGGAMGPPVAPVTMGSGLLSPGATAAAGGGLMETMQPFMNAAKTGMETARATQQPEEQMQPSPFLMQPQGGSGPQQMQQLVQSIEQSNAQRFPQRVRRY